jgi:DNA polymerase-3 subunit alpha
MSASFVHTHLHSEYSLVDSTIRIKAMVAACAQAGMPAVALTDECNMFALVKFYKACNAAGVKPICGSDLWIGAPDDPRPWRLTLLCQHRAWSRAPGRKASTAAAHWSRRPGSPPARRTA